jgi:hypothetical protein
MPESRVTPVRNSVQLRQSAVRKVAELFSTLSRVVWRTASGLLQFIGTILTFVFGAFAVSFFGYLAYSAIWELGVSKEYKDWQEVTRTRENDKPPDQLGRYFEFLKDHPDPEPTRKKAATHQIDELAWSIAETTKMDPYCYSESDLRSHSRINWPYEHISYADYLSSFPTGRHAAEASVRLDDLCYAYAKQNDDSSGPPHSYMRYLEFHPDGKYATYARWGIAGRYYDLGVTYESRDYLQKVFEPMLVDGDQHVRERAQAALDEIDAWDRSVKTNTFEGFLRHLQHWPDGLYHALAVRMLEFHGRWKSQTITGRVLEALSNKVRDPIDLKEVPARLHDYRDDQKDLANLCRKDQDFIDVVDGYALAAEYHDRYRRRFYFGFDAPFDEQAKTGTVLILKSLDLVHLKAIVQTAWRSASLTAVQRRKLQRLAFVALEHEKVFDAGFDQVNAQILTAKWQSFQFGGWHELHGFPKPLNSCYALGFDNFVYGITQTLFDFWYERTLDGTKIAARTAFQAVLAAEVRELP